MPEPDEQVRAETNQFPGDKERDEISREDECQHGAGEEAELGEEATAMAVPGHVAGGIDEHDEPNDRHEYCHQRAELIEPEGKCKLPSSNRKPGHGDRCMLPLRGIEQPEDGYNGRASHCRQSKACRKSPKTGK